jgi:hypothetical protein
MGDETAADRQPGDSPGEVSPCHNPKHTLAILRAACLESAEKEIDELKGQRRVFLGLLRLIATEALGEPTDEYVSVPTRYALEAARLANVADRAGSPAVDTVAREIVCRHVDRMASRHDGTPIHTACYACIAARLGGELSVQRGGDRNV